MHRYQGCDAPTRLYEIGNGGHTWPGDENGLPRFIVGQTSLDFNASEVSPDFFGLSTPSTKPQRHEEHKEKN